jgi:hypothetical protein
MSKVWIRRKNGLMWEAQWTPFFSTTFPNCDEGSILFNMGSEVILPPIETYQVWEYPSGPWSAPETHVVIPWHEGTWLDISKLNPVINRG